MREIWWSQCKQCIVMSYLLQCIFFFNQAIIKTNKMSEGMRKLVWNLKAFVVLSKRFIYLIYGDVNEVYRSDIIISPEAPWVMLIIFQLMKSKSHDSNVWSLKRALLVSLWSLLTMTHRVWDVLTYAMKSMDIVQPFRTFVTLHNQNHNYWRSERTPLPSLKGI